MEEISDERLQWIQHIWTQYHTYLGTERNVHVIGGLIAPDQTVPIAQGLSTTGTELENHVYRMLDNEPLKHELGIEGAVGCWFLYFDVPTAEYDESKLGHYGEVMVRDEEGGVTRLAIKYTYGFPADGFPAYVDEPLSFPWERLT